MVEKRDGHIRAQFAQIGRYHPQVVIVDPHRGVFRRLLGSALGEQAVDLEEYLPVILLERRPLPEGVQCGPEGFLGEFLIENIHIFSGQWHPCRHQVFEIFIIHFRMGFKLALLRIVQ